MLKRSSGILMPVFSLPSEYGIGTIGKAAYDFIDKLSEAGQSWWQLLPVGPTGFGDSPYQSFSTFAGNPYFIDLDMLIEEGLLDGDDICNTEDADKTRVNYGRIYETRIPVLKKAARKGLTEDPEAFEAFKQDNRGWLEDYGLFMACKEHFGMKAWSEWDEDIRLRTEEATEKYEALLKSRAEEYRYIQYLFFKQWKKLKDYAGSKGIGLIGDMPFYVAMDSADVWSERRFFALDEKGVPCEVAGVPPDDFSDDGQLWGNPLYDWDEMKKDGYGWWIRRVDGASKLFDVIRIDHFRGMASYWTVPYGEKTAVNGCWRKGPGMDLVGVLTGWFPDISFIAEDLGVMTADVIELLKTSGLPGMRVLEFAFGSDSKCEHLPHNYEANCICYSGTHDNDTLKSWRERAPVESSKAEQYFSIQASENFNLGMIRGGMGSVAKLFVAPIQDWLELGSEGRINEPGTSQGNWTWRMKENGFSQELVDRIRELTELYGRA